MDRKAKKQAGRQVGADALTVHDAVQRLVVPMIAGVQATKSGLLALVHQLGLAALDELLTEEAAAIVGAKGKHVEARRSNHWGTKRTRLPFGGRHVTVKRPRVRRVDGGEVELPSIEALRQSDALPTRVAEQIVLGVSTRGYRRSLESGPAGLAGTSKSAASRALIVKTAEKLAAFAQRSLAELELAAMFLDGMEFSGKTVIVALGVTTKGCKVPLGLWMGSTEDSVVAGELVQDLLARGLRIEGRMLFVIDGGKGIRKALGDVFGDRAVMQRCQVHKARNLKSHVSKKRWSYVKPMLNEAYRSATFATAKKKLQQLLSWLERNGEESAASSLKEGLDETLTVLRLGLSGALCRTFATTNPIENLNGTIRRVHRNVKRWRGESMIRRWVALGIAEAAQRFRSIRGYKSMPELMAALHPNPTSVDPVSQVA
jgi:putative transposase